MVRAVKNATIASSPSKPFKGYLKPPIMSFQVSPITLEYNGIRLEPLSWQHEEGLRAATQDGELWQLVVTSAPEPDKVADYIQTALNTPNRLAFAVIESESGRVLGSTSYHDIVPEIQRVEIGYTWYRQSVWRSKVNTICKWLLLTHAFETLNAAVVGWRTDSNNHRSQVAIERIGGKRDGVIRHFSLRRDGTVRDYVFYSMLKSEWPDAKKALATKLS